MCVLSNNFCVLGLGLYAIGTQILALLINLYNKVSKCSTASTWPLWLWYCTRWAKNRPRFYPYISLLTLTSSMTLI